MRISTSRGTAFTALRLVSLAGVLALMLTAATAGASTARGLHLVGSNDFDELAPTRNTEIEVRGNFVYMGSYTPLDEDGLSPGLKVVDVADPTAPSLSTNFPVPGLLMDVQVNNDVDRCGYGKDPSGLSDPACNTVLGTTQGAPGRQGIWLFDISDPTNAEPWGWDPSKSFTEQVSFVPFAPRGSHNGFLFGDFAFVGGIGGNTFEIWDISPLFEDPPQPPVQVATYNNLADNRPIRPQRETQSSHDLFVQRNPDGRVFTYVPGTHFYIVDVTDVVEGTTTGDISDHLVGFNNYVNSDGTVTATLWENTFAHYAEPTDDGDTTYVGDETIFCGEAAGVHILDSSDLPAVGEPPKLLPEIGTMQLPTANAPLCANRNADGETPEGQNREGEKQQRLRRSGHNFRIYGDVLTQGHYGEGVFVWDISDRANPEIVAQFRGVRSHGGKVPEENKEGATFSTARFVWQAVSDGDPEAVLAGEQHIYASDVVNGLYVLRMRPT